MQEIYSSRKIISKMEEEDEIRSTPPELRALANESREQLVPKKSKITYEKVYEVFSEWYVIKTGKQKVS